MIWPAMTRIAGWLNTHWNEKFININDYKCFFDPMNMDMSAVV